MKNYTLEQGEVYIGLGISIHSNRKCKLSNPVMMLVLGLKKSLINLTNLTVGESLEALPPYEENRHN